MSKDVAICRGTGDLDDWRKQMLDWAILSALPLWADAGFDRQHGRFEERLTLAGGAVLDVPIRLLSQARQIFVYALAAQRGWHANARALVEQAFSSMIRDYHRRDGAPGWVFSIWRDGTVADGRRDFYAHAFALLAIACYVQATGRRDALALAEETLDFLDRDMAAPLGGGYLEALPVPVGPRRQNPHMHLFEALLHLWGCSGDERYKARLGGLFYLFASRFFHRAAGVIGEYFSADLSPADGVAGKIAEPGHHYEWVWLLRQYERMTGRSMTGWIDPLYAHADRQGFDADGLIVDEILADGTHHLCSHRVWPMTEAIRANCVEARWGRPYAAAKAATLSVQLHERFLAPALGGGWIDRLDAEGKPVTDFMPASTFYHLMGGIDELNISSGNASVRSAAGTCSAPHAQDLLQEARGIDGRRQAT